MRENRQRGIVLTWIMFAALILVMSASVVIVLTSQPAPIEVVIMPPAPTMTPAPTATPAPVTAYVTGAVAQPNQIVTLPPGSRVSDALIAAGGALATADLERVNLAGVLRDGDQIHVPAIDAPAAVLPTPGMRSLAINTATLDDLVALPDIGPALAADIIAYREANGPFRSLADLDAVPGIGPALIETITLLIRFD